MINDEDYMNEDEIHYYFVEMKQALKNLLATIDEAQNSGCIDYLDAGQNGSGWWYTPVAEARRIIKEIEVG